MPGADFRRGCARDLARIPFLESRKLLNVGVGSLPGLRPRLRTAFNFVSGVEGQLISNL